MEDNRELFLGGWFDRLITLKRPVHSSRLRSNTASKYSCMTGDHKVNLLHDKVNRFGQQHAVRLYQRLIWCRLQVLVC